MLVSSSEPSAHTISGNETLVVEIQEDRSHFSMGRDLLIQDTGRAGRKH